MIMNTQNTQEVQILTPFIAIRVPVSIKTHMTLKGQISIANYKHQLSITSVVWQKTNAILARGKNNINNKI